MVQAEDLLQTKKLIPDLSMWIQCFTLYAAVLAPHQPERVGDLMAYMTIIAKASKSTSGHHGPQFSTTDRQQSITILVKG